jgi:hypothetical protein
MNPERFIGFFEPIEDLRDPRGRPGTPNRPREITGTVSRRKSRSALNAATYRRRAVLVEFSRGARRSKHGELGTVNPFKLVGNQHLGDPSSTCECSECWLGNKSLSRARTYGHLLPDQHSLHPTYARQSNPILTKCLATETKTHSFANESPRICCRNSTTLLLQIVEAAPTTFACYSKENYRVPRAKNWYVHFSTRARNHSGRTTPQANLIVCSLPKTTELLPNAPPPNVRQHRLRRRKKFSNTRPRTSAQNSRRKRR